MAELWQKPPILQDPYEPIDFTALSVLERDLRISLPGSYVDFLTRQNGGCFRQMTESGTAATIAIRAFYPFTSNADSNLSQAVRLNRGRINKRFVPIGYSGIGQLILIENTKKADTQVFGFDLDSGKVKIVCSSFVEFLDRVRYSAEQEELWTETAPPFLHIERGDVGYLSTFDHLLDRKSKYGQGPLACAAAALQPRVVEFLLDIGADPNQLDVDGFSPLMLAGRNGGYEICCKLLHGGANPSLADSEGMTALDWATAYNATRVRELLELV